MNDKACVKFLQWVLPQLHMRWEGFRKVRVNFFCQDLRSDTPPGRFDLILCRNLAFTYFDDELQRRIVRRLAGVLQPQAYLVIGIHETLPQEYDDFEAFSKRLGIYQRRS